MSNKARGWYAISFTGGLLVALYLLVPVYVVYADSLGLITSFSRTSAMGGMLFVIMCAIAARRQRKRLFSRHKKGDHRAGFTFIELLIVISIIGILSALLFPVFSSARDAAYFSRTKAEMRSMSTALELYANDNGSYPPDANRDIPPGLEPYLAGSGEWPKAPWPGSVYDWDHWSAGELTYNPKQEVYQISIRFCPLGQPSQCKFPNEPWADDFDYYSAVYYCVSGPCRSHSVKPLDHPGYCINC